MPESEKPDFETFLKQVPKNSTPLHQAALYGYLDYAKKILDLKSKKNPKGKTAEEIRHLLLAKDSNDNLPLDRAAARGHNLVVRLLLETHEEYGVDYPDPIPNRQNYTPLLAAVRWYFNVLDGSYNKGPILVGKFNAESTNPKKESDFQYVHRVYRQIIDLLIESLPQHVEVGADNKGCNALYYLIRIHLEAKKNEKLEKTDSMIASYKEIAQEAESIYKKLLEKGMSLDEGASTTNGQSPRTMGFSLGSTLPLPPPKVLRETKEEDLSEESDTEDLPSHILTESPAFFTPELKEKAIFFEGRALPKLINAFLGTWKMPQNAIDDAEKNLKEILKPYSAVINKKQQRAILKCVENSLSIDIKNNTIIIDSNLPSQLRQFKPEQTVSLHVKPV